MGSFYTQRYTIFVYIMICMYIIVYHDMYHSLIQKVSNVEMSNVIDGLAQFI